MAVTRVNQGEIVEVPFELPDGSIWPHPALVLSSCDCLSAGALSCAIMAVLL